MEDVAVETGTREEAIRVSRVNSIKYVRLEIPNDKRASPHGPNDAVIKQLALDKVEPPILSTPIKSLQTILKRIDPSLLNFSPAPEWKDFEIDLRQRYLDARRIIPQNMTRNKCARCVMAKMSICDHGYPIWNADLEPRKCTFCATFSFDCEYLKQDRDRSLSIVTDQCMKRIGDIIKDQIPTAEFIQRKQGNKNVALLPNDLQIESSLLDAIHRATSNHIQADVEYSEKENLLFKMFESQTLLGFALLVEEIMREFCLDMVNVTKKDEEDGDLTSKNTIPEFMAYRGKNEDAKRVIKSRRKQWIQQQKNPPTPPYLKKQ